MTDGLEIEGHTSRSFNDELSALHVRVVEMGGLVLLQVREAANAYVDWGPRLAEDVLERERQVNGWQTRLDDEAMTLIARRQPVANDLRAILSLSRIVSELERTGDEAKKIALAVMGRNGHAAERPGTATARDTRHLSRLASNMLRLTLDALDRLDPAIAEKVVALDSELDEEYASGMRRLLTRAMEDPRQFSVALQSAFVLKALERVGDHACNVSRLVLAIGGPAAGAVAARAAEERRESTGTDP
jgi:phosphate transport system protein